MGTIQQITTEEEYTVAIETEVLMRCPNVFKAWLFFLAVDGRV